MKPLFIFSLPRSGSSLLQKMLAAHSRIDSASEPWILLPLVGMVGSRNIVSISNYSAASSQLAMQDLLRHGSGPGDSFLRASRAFADQVYAGHCGKDTVYFLDKTPRYYLIIDEIREIFPEARFVFLWRNPLAVMASIIKTWQGGRFRLHRNKIDIYEGVRCLHEGFAKHGENACSLKYEELVRKPEQSLTTVCDFLELEYEAAMITGFGKVSFGGEMGDHGENSRLAYLSDTSLDAWKTVLNGTIRRWYCRRYIDRIGEEMLATFGHSKDELLRALRQEPMRFGPVLSDLWWLAASGSHELLTRSLLGRGKQDAGMYKYLLD